MNCYKNFSKKPIGIKVGSVFMCEHVCTEKDTDGDCCICTLLDSVTINDFCPNCHSRAYTDQLNKSNWRFLTIIDIRRQSSEWRWVYHLPLKSCLHTFWQIYFENVKHDYYLRCLICDYSFVSHKIPNLK